MTIDGVPEGLFDVAKPVEGYGAGAGGTGGLVVGVGCGYRATNTGSGAVLLPNSSGTSTIVVEDVVINNASIAINYPAVCTLRVRLSAIFHSPKTATSHVGQVCGTGLPPQDAVVRTPHRFAAVLIRNVTATGGEVGLLLNDNVSNPAAGLVQYDITATGYKFPVNISYDPRYKRRIDNAQWFNNSWVPCWQVGSRATHGDCNYTLPTMQPQLQLLTPFVPQVLSSTSANLGRQWIVEFRNGGLASGEFTLERLDSRLRASATRWHLAARTPSAATPTRLVLTAAQADLEAEAPKTACGELSDGSSSAQFCVSFADRE